MNDPAIDKSIPLNLLDATPLVPGARQVAREKIARNPVTFDAERPLLRKPDWIRVRLPSSNAVQVLKDKAIAGAALDVFWDEPIIDPELRRLPNVVLTPHIASATVETRQAMAALTLQNLESFYQKKPVPTPVPERT